MRYWRTTELRTLRELADQPRHQIAAALGRSERAITEQARRLRIDRTGPLRGRWPPSTVERVRRLRAQRESVSEIAKRTGVPFGTVRRWIYAELAA